MGRGLASLQKYDRSLMTPILALGHNGNRSLVNTTAHKLHESPSYKALYRRFAVVRPGIKQRLQQVLHRAFLGSDACLGRQPHNCESPFS